MAFMMKQTIQHSNWYRYDEKDLNDKYIGNAKRYDLIYKYYKNIIPNVPWVSVVQECMPRKWQRNSANEA